MKTFILSIVIFIIGYNIIWSDVDNPSVKNKDYTCMYVQKDLCVIEANGDKVEKADISHLDHKNLISGSKVIYKSETPREIAIGHTVSLGLFCFVFFVIIRIFVACVGNGRGFDLSSVFDALD